MTYIMTPINELSVTNLYSIQFRIYKMVHNVNPQSRIFTAMYLSLWCIIQTNHSWSVNWNKASAIINLPLGACYSVSVQLSCSPGQLLVASQVSHEPLLFVCVLEGRQAEVSMLKNNEIRKIQMSQHHIDTFANGKNIFINYSNITHM